MVVRTKSVFSRDFKLSAVHRMLAGESVSALARELGIRRKRLYLWRESFRSGGPEGLRPRGRPRKPALMEPAVSAAASPASAALPGPAAAAQPQLASAAELTAARQRIAALEAKIGRQQLELDFFRQALRQVGQAPRPQGKAGARISTPSSKR